MGAVIGPHSAGPVDLVFESEDFSCNQGRHLLPAAKPAHGEETWLPRPMIGASLCVAGSIGQHSLPLAKPNHGEQVWLPDEQVGGSLCVAGSIGQHSLPLAKPNHGDDQWHPPFGQ